MNENVIDVLMDRLVAKGEDCFADGVVRDYFRTLYFTTIDTFMERHGGLPLTDVMDLARQEMDFHELEAYNFCERRRNQEAIDNLIQSLAYAVIVYDAHMLVSSN